MKNRPDWKNPKKYEYVNGLSLNQLAWEFLRRNPEYVKDWDLCNKTPLRDKDSKFEKAFFEVSFKWGISGELKDPDKTYEDIKVDSDLGIAFEPLGGDDTFLLDKTEDEEIRILLGLPDFKTGAININFNFLLPINPQLEVAKKRLYSLQKSAKEKWNLKTRKAFKPRKDEWILLLRVLDAEAAGATNKEIANVLFPHEQSDDVLYGADKKVYDKKKQARRYLFYDYRLISFISDK